MKKLLIFQLCLILMTLFIGGCFLDKWFGHDDNDTPSVSIESTSIQGYIFVPEGQEKASSKSSCKVNPPTGMAPLADAIGVVIATGQKTTLRIKV